MLKKKNPINKPSECIKTLKLKNISAGGKNQYKDRKIKLRKLPGTQEKKKRQNTTK